MNHRLGRVRRAVHAWAFPGKSPSLTLFRWFRNYWVEHVTKTGRYVLSAGVLTCIAAVFPDIMAGSTAFSAFAAIAVVSWTALLIYRPRLSAVRRLPAQAGAGTTVKLSITVTNQGRRPALCVGAFEYRLPRQLKMGDDVLYTMHIAPGQQHQFEYDVELKRRGVYDLPGPSTLCAFPLGILQRRRFHAQHARLVVYPQFHPINRLEVPAGRRYQPGGMALTSKLGDSMEFIGNREYRSGDRLRDLHPRSWARVGYPVVRQFQEEFLTRVALIVDTWVPPQPQISFRLQLREPVQHPNLEANLSLAAGVADYLARQQYVIDLFAAGPELFHFQAGRSLAYLDNILEVLACIEPCPDDPLGRIGPQLHDQLRQISTVVLLLLHWDDSRQQLVNRLRAQQVDVKVIVVSDSVTAAQLAGAGPGSRCFTPAMVHNGIDSF